MPKAEIDKRVARAAEILQIEPLLDRKPGALSGGQRQRVAIGRALVRDVDVFLFDEPLSNLDAKLRSELRVEIKRLHTRLNNTMVYVTHDQIEALTLADRIAVMRGGIIQQLDAPQVIYNRPSNLFVAGFIGSPSMNFLHGATVDSGRAFQFGAIASTLPAMTAARSLDRPKAILGLRPEHIEIGLEERPGVSLPAVVEIDEPMGADSLVWLKAGGQQMSVRVPVERRLPAGHAGASAARHLQGLALRRGDRTTDLTMLDLAGLWTLSDESGAHALPFDLPGDGITALQAAGAIPDPYWGRNEYDLRWIAERDWVARRSFAHDGTPCDLVIDGLDTVAEVRLNGVLVLSSANMLPALPGRCRPGCARARTRSRSPSASSLRGGRRRAGGDAVSDPLSRQQLPDPQRQHAAQAAVRFRLGLEHRAGALRPLRRRPAGAEGRRGSTTSSSRRPMPAGVADVSVAEVHTDGCAEVTATLCGVDGRQPLHRVAWRG